jgi:hypothetical protein
MIATLVRSSVMLCVALAFVGWQAGRRETKSGSAVIGEAMLMVIMLITVNVATVVIARTLTAPFLAALPRGGWSSFPVEVIVTALNVVLGLWTASILLQFAQNIGRRTYGLPTEPIEWIRHPNKSRRKTRKRKQRVK